MFFFNQNNCFFQIDDDFVDDSLENEILEYDEPIITFSVIISFGFGTKFRFSFFHFQKFNSFSTMDKLLFVIFVLLGLYICGQFVAHVHTMITLNGKTQMATFPTGFSRHKTSFFLESFYYQRTTRRYYCLNKPKTIVFFFTFIFHFN